MTERIEGDDEGSAPAGFPGLKAPDALRTIGEVATAVGIRQHVLRYWEEQFPMLRPVKRSGGRRYYRPEDVALLRTIHRMVDQEGYTLRGARLAIEAGAGTSAAAAEAPSVEPLAAATPPIAAAPPAVAAMSGETLVRLRQIRRVLSEALAAS